MGLDTSHDCWHGAYSAFSKMREALAVAAGYKIKRDPSAEWRTFVDIPWAQYQGNLEGEWAETPADPLLVLIAHSDCDGVIYPAQAGPLADRMEELLKLLPTGFEEDWIRVRAAKFVEGLRRAVAAGEPVEFH